MTRRFFRVAALAMLGGIGLWAADPACRPVLEALQKLSTLPVHMFNSETADYHAGQTRMSELIYLNQSSYIYVGGKWRVSPMTDRDRQEIRKTADENSGTATCRVLGEESIDGEAATIYSIHQQTPDEKLDSKVWISKSRALPVKQVSDLDVGGMSGKSHRTTRYDFKNVQAPAGVH